MRRLVLLAATGATLVGPAAAAQAAPRVDVMVVGRHGVVRDAKAVALEARTVRVSGHRCAVGARTPLSALAATRLRLTLRDYAACSRRARDAAGLYVRAVAGQRARGTSGWVYKVGHRLGTAGAADPAGSFGTGRQLRGGQDVLWFWCRLRGAGCQRTLDTRVTSRRVHPGASVRVAVRGYDDQGAGAAVPGATVRLGRARAVTGADGVATLTAPAHTGRYRLRAERSGTVPAFPRRVTVR